MLKILPTIMLDVVDAEVIGVGDEPSPPEYEAEPDADSKVY
jgi:hypothetical protein